MQPVPKLNNKTIFEIFIDKGFATLNGYVPNQQQTVPGARPEACADIGGCGCRKISFKILTCKLF